MITQCPYCSVNSAGEHEFTCPNFITKKNGIDKFLYALNIDNVEVSPAPAQVLIGEYIELLSAYAITVDAIELAGEDLGAENLEKVSQYIKIALKAKIHEIVVLQELNQ